MKRITTFLILAILLIYGCMDAKNLKVYSTTGNISKKNGNSWVALIKNTVVRESETVKINPSSSLKVLDSDTRQIFTFETQGEFKIADLLKKSAKENSSLFGRINSEVKNNFASSNTKSHKNVGASKRALWEEEELEKLFTAVFEGLENGEDRGGIKVSKIETGDGLFYMEFNNNGTEPIFVNLFVGDEDGNWATVYEFEGEESALLIPGEKTIKIEHMVFAPLPDSHFVVVGYKEPFDAAQLAEMLSDNLEPQEEALKDVSLYFVK